MASARLRKIFHYPEDSGDDEYKCEELDEEGVFLVALLNSRIFPTNSSTEQESVIEGLRIQNNRRNTEYRTTFAVIPLLLTLIFIPSVFSKAPNPQDRVFSFFGISSLIATAYTMKYLPIQRPDSRGKRSMQDPGFLVRIRKLLLLANTAICGLLLLMYIFSPVESSHNTQQTVYIVPGLMLAIVLLAQKMMVSINLNHLESLRYSYKGV
ncbi:hypothetical protein BDV28DRAFT_161717 [Aspergillus coremiiformis]|uniref:Uncharacterized protein n=1 Tax=Aspergillus coremiiformis TaxID=138285 RepID=A0A5N6YUC9_9EURO|nr:hypothetical protein BDV28DRAFT_161717 [Aspergillus coremiiformis]